MVLDSIPSMSTNEFTSLINNKNKTIGVGLFIHLKKSFDTINHDILLKNAGQLWGKRSIK